MRILVTGATGFLGNNLVRQLIQSGHDVVVAVRHSSDRRPLDGLTVERAEIDLCNPADVLPVVSSVDAVIHSAAMIQIGWTRREESIAFNVGSTKALAESARLKEKSMVLVSTVDTLGQTQPGEVGDETLDVEPVVECSYVVSKKAADRAFAEQVALGLHGVNVKPGFMVGPYDWKPSSGEMMISVAQTPLYFAPAGGCSAVDVRDVAAGIESALHHGRSGESYVLGGHNVSYLELWTRMATLIGKRPPRRPFPDWIVGIAGRVGDLVSKVRGTELTVNSAATTMGQHWHHFSSDKAAKELGYQIGDLDNALGDSWDWFTRHEYV